MFSDPTFWVAVGFLIFVVAAGRPIMAKIGSALDNRAAEIASKLEEAKTIKQEFDKAWEHADIDIKTSIL